MDGEIITNAEMRQAGQHAETLRQVAGTNPGLSAALDPVRDFLDRLHWKGM